MSTKNLLYEDLLNIHPLLTNALNSAEKHLKEFLETRLPEGKTRKGFIIYIESLLKQFHSHHDIEETILFPLVGDKIPEIDCDALREQHKMIDPLFDEIDDTTASIKKGENDAKDYKRLDETLAKLKEYWLDHISKEEFEFSNEQIPSILTEKDQRKLMKRMVRKGQAHARPMSQMVAFVLYSFNSNQRVEFEKRIPGIVTKLLVPFVWKPQWKIMKQFFAYPP